MKEAEIGHISGKARDINAVPLYPWPRRDFRTFVRKLPGRSGNLVAAHPGFLACRVPQGTPVEYSQAATGGARSFKWPNSAT